MRRILSKKVNICGIYASLEEVFEFCWSSLADERNTLPKSTRKHVKLDKFVFGIPWLPDLLCKHWFASSVWNFCHWVADVPPRETSPVAKSKEKRMFSQASLFISVTSAQGKRLQGGIYEWLRCKYVKHHSRVQIEGENWDREEH